jgi:hypothetical protein
MISASTKHNVIKVLLRSGRLDLANAVARTVVAGVSRAAAFEMFKEAGNKMWASGEQVTSLVTLSQEEPTAGTLASLARPTGRLRAVGNIIIRPAAKYVLRVSDRLLGMGTDHVRKIMIHEAGHLGYDGHGTDFRSIVTRNGGALSETGLQDGDAFHIQRKEGSRFKTIKSFENEQAARIWVREEARRQPGRYRMLM